MSERLSATAADTGPGSATAAARSSQLPPPAARDGALLALAQALRQSGYRFTTVTPATHARVNQRPGNAWAASVEDVFGWSRPFRRDGGAGGHGPLPPHLFELLEAADALRPHAGGWHATVRFSTLGGQLFAHSAYPTLAADAVFFGPDTYRFAAALQRRLATRDRPVRRAVDIGCGAGPGALVIAAAHPHAEVLAVDINAEALRLTALNARLNGTPNVQARRSDLLDGVDGAFDLIVANPPYLLDHHERAYRHGGGGLGEGLSLAIAALANQRLAPGGELLLYTGSAIVGGVDGFRDALAPVLDRGALDWRYEELDPDVFGEELHEPAYGHVDRIAAVWLTACAAV